MISLIYAITQNNVLGDKGTLPWKLQADMARFKTTTMGHVVVMGRKTYESIGKPLQGRKNIILTRNLNYTNIHCDVCTDYTKILDIKDDVFIIGGREIYELFLPYADRIHQTLIQGEIVGDTIWNQSFLDKGWKLVEQNDYYADKENQYNTSYKIYERVEVND